MLGYRVPHPDEALLIAGGKGKKDGTPFKVVTGHGAFVIPFVRSASFLTLAMRESEVAEQCVTTQGIALQVKAVIAFKVGNDPESIVNAAQRFLSDQDQMAILTGRIFAGHLRSIVGSMTVEEIVTAHPPRLSRRRFASRPSTSGRPRSSRPSTRRTSIRPRRSPVRSGRCNRPTPSAR